MARTFALLSAILLVACTPRKEPVSEPITRDLPPLAASTKSSPLAPLATGAAAPSVGESSPSANVARQAPARLDSLKALKAAKAAGLKRDIFVSSPVTCPLLPKPTRAPLLLAAKGKLAGVVVDMDGFLKEEVGVPEASGLLGPPVLCNGGEVAGFLDLFLAPRDANVKAVRLETHDDDLIGIIVEFEKPVSVDMVDLEQRLGKPRHMPGPHDSFEAGSNTFSIKNDAYSAQFLFAHRDHKDPQAAWQVHQIIFRRTSSR